MPLNADSSPSRVRAMKTGLACSLARTASPIDPGEPPPSEATVIDGKWEPHLP